MMDFPKIGSEGISSSIINGVASIFCSSGGDYSFFSSSGFLSFFLPEIVLAPPLTVDLLTDPLTAADFLTATQAGFGFADTFDETPDFIF